MKKLKSGRTYQSKTIVTREKSCDDNSELETTLPLLIVKSSSKPVHICQYNITPDEA